MKNTSAIYVDAPSNIKFFGQKISIKDILSIVIFSAVFLLIFGSMGPEMWIMSIPLLAVLLWSIKGEETDINISSREIIVAKGIIWKPYKQSYSLDDFHEIVIKRELLKRHKSNIEYEIYSIWLINKSEANLKLASSSSLSEVSEAARFLSQRINVPVIDVTTGKEHTLTEDDMVESSSGVISDNIGLNSLSKPKLSSDLFKARVEILREESLTQIRIAYPWLHLSHIIVFIVVVFMGAQFFNTYHQQINLFLEDGASFNSLKYMDKMAIFIGAFLAVFLSVFVFSILFTEKKALITINAPQLVIMDRDRFFQGKKKPYFKSIIVADEIIAIDIIESETSSKESSYLIIRAGNEIIKTGYGLSTEDLNYIKLMIVNQLNLKGI